MAMVKDFDKDIYNTLESIATKYKGINYIVHYPPNLHGITITLILSEYNKTITLSAEELSPYLNPYTFIYTTIDIAVQKLIAMDESAKESIAIANETDPEYVYKTGQPAKSSQAGPAWDQILINMGYSEYLGKVETIGKAMPGTPASNKKRKSIKSIKSAYNYDYSNDIEEDKPYPFNKLNKVFKAMDAEKKQQNKGPIKVTNTIKDQMDKVLEHLDQLEKKMDKGMDQLEKNMADKEMKLSDKKYSNAKEFFNNNSEAAKKLVE